MTLAHPSGIGPQSYHLHATLASKRSLDLTFWLNTYRVVKVSLYTSPDSASSTEKGNSDSTTSCCVVFHCMFPPDSVPFQIKLERSPGLPEEDRFSTPSPGEMDSSILINSFVPEGQISILDASTLACVVKEYEPYHKLGAGHSAWFSYVIFRVLRQVYGANPSPIAAQGASRKRSRNSTSGLETLQAIVKGRKPPEGLPKSVGLWEGVDLKRSDGDLARDCEDIRAIFQDRIRDEMQEIRKTIKAELQIQSKVQKSLKENKKREKEVARLAEAKRQLDGEMTYRLALAESEEWMVGYESRMECMIKNWGQFRAAHAAKKRKAEERIEAIESRLGARMAELDLTSM